eukprot:TRINITY_DN3793_c0_g2_i1.p1 TRINITY_DN3793_c0_g2~~TRINITY_DN3793_c0_g2_i1.p1  ORF type:complete len:1201 (-),score=266.40 TRINITY_DN3793_c0_g2_i1:1391-4993(-)
MFCVFFFQAEDGIRDFCLSRGLGDVYKRQLYKRYFNALVKNTVRRNSFRHLLREAKNYGSIICMKNAWKRWRMTYNRRVALNIMSSIINQAFIGKIFREFRTRKSRLAVIHSKVSSQKTSHTKRIFFMSLLRYYRKKKENIAKMQMLKEAKENTLVMTGFTKWKKQFDLMCVGVKFTLISLMVIKRQLQRKCFDALHTNRRLKILGRQALSFRVLKLRERLFRFWGQRTSAKLALNSLLVHFLQEKKFRTKNQITDSWKALVARRKEEQLKVVELIRRRKGRVLKNWIAIFNSIYQIGMSLRSPRVTHIKMKWSPEAYSKNQSSQRAEQLTQREELFREWKANKINRLRRLIFNKWVELHHNRRERLSSEAEKFEQFQKIRSKLAFGKWRALSLRRTMKYQSTRIIAFFLERLQMVSALHKLRGHGGQLRELEEEALKLSHKRDRGRLLTLAFNQLKENYLTKARLRAALQILLRNRRQRIYQGFLDTLSYLRERRRMKVKLRQETLNYVGRLYINRMFFSWVKWTKQRQKVKEFTTRWLQLKEKFAFNHLVLVTSLLKKQKVVKSLIEEARKKKSAKELFTELKKRVEQRRRKTIIIRTLRANQKTFLKTVFCSWLKQVSLRMLKKMNILKARNFHRRKEMALECEFFVVLKTILLQSLETQHLSTQYFLAKTKRKAFALWSTSWKISKLRKGLISVFAKRKEKRILLSAFGQWAKLHWTEKLLRGILLKRQQKLAGLAFRGWNDVSRTSAAVKNFVGRRMRKWARTFIATLARLKDSNAVVKAALKRRNVRIKERIFYQLVHHARNHRLLREKRMQKNLELVHLSFNTWKEYFLRQRRIQDLQDNFKKRFQKKILDEWNRAMRNRREMISRLCELSARVLKANLVEVVDTWRINANSQRKKSALLRVSQLTQRNILRNAFSKVMSNIGERQALFQITRIMCDTKRRLLKDAFAGLLAHSTDHRRIQQLTDTMSGLVLAAKLKCFSSIRHWSQLSESFKSMTSLLERRIIEDGWITFRSRLDEHSKSIEAKISEFTSKSERNRLKNALTIFRENLAQNTEIVEDFRAKREREGLHAAFRQWRQVSEEESAANLQLLAEVATYANRKLLSVAFRALQLSVEETNSLIREFRSISHYRTKAETFAILKSVWETRIAEENASLLYTVFHGWKLFTSEQRSLREYLAESERRLASDDSGNLSS